MSGSPRPMGERSILEQVTGDWDDDRRTAFSACYRVMRTADDIVDERRTRGMPIPARERREIVRTIATVIRDGLAPHAELIRGLLIPSWPWRRWMHAMRYDLAQGFFPTYQKFLSYAEGAAVAPGAIFMHLCAVGDRVARIRPRFNVRRAARPLALFCYHTHILRDMKEDAHDGIVFVPDDMLRRQGLDRSAFLSALHGPSLPSGVVAVAEWYHERAAVYEGLSRDMLRTVSTHCSAQYHRSLERLFELYVALYRSMDIRSGCFTKDAIGTRAVVSSC